MYTVVKINVYVFMLNILELFLWNGWPFFYLKKNDWLLSGKELKLFPIVLTRKCRDTILKAICIHFVLQLIMY